VFNHEERRPRVLLAHRNEIAQILKKQEQKGEKKSAL
jgi:tmRNA-binding protein